MTWWQWVKWIGTNLLISRFMYLTIWILVKEWRKLWLPGWSVVHSSPMPLQGSKEVHIKQWHSQTFPMPGQWMGKSLNHAIHIYTCPFSYMDIFFNAHSITSCMQVSYYKWLDIWMLAIPNTLNTQQCLNTWPRKNLHGD